VTTRVTARLLSPLLLQLRMLGKHYAVRARSPMLRMTTPWRDAHCRILIKRSGLMLDLPERSLRLPLEDEQQLWADVADPAGLDCRKAKRFAV